MERTTRKRRTAAKGREGTRRKVNTGPPEPEEDEGLNLADKIVSIELISREVFRRLDFKDLLNCSLVNRTWRASARLHLRTHCRCFLSLSFSPQTMKLKRRKFRDLYDLLTNSSDVPFNRISITSPSQQSSHQSDKEDVISFSESEDTSSDESEYEGTEGTAFQETGKERFISALEWEGALGRMEVKYLELDWRAEPVSPSSRLAIKEILRRSSSSLVDLTVLGWETRRGLPHFFGVNVLPEVKVLQLPGKNWRGLNAVDLEELLNALPRLQFIRGPVDQLSLPAFVRTNKQHLIHEFDFATLSVLELEERDQKAADELLEISTTFARSQPKLTKLTLVTTVKGKRGFELLASGSRYLIVMEALVRGGAEVLKEVQLRHGDLMQLISRSHPMSHAQRHSPPLFPAVTNLSLQYVFKLFSSEFNLTGLKKLNLEAHFPLLHSLELDFEIGCLFVSPCYERRTDDYCCKTVRRLAVRNKDRLFMTGSEATSMATFTRLFPMVRVLVMQDCNELLHMSESLWGDGRALWEELRVLRLEGMKEDIARMNWDPFFTGLSMEEYDRLERQCEPPDVQFFEALRLMPRERRRGSLMDFQKLEKLQLGMEHGAVCLTRTGDVQAFASKLIAECVSLMRLRVEIKRRLCRKQLNCYQAVNYLQPFVHFIDKFTD